MSVAFIATRLLSSIARAAAGRGGSGGQAELLMIGVLWIVIVVAMIYAITRHE